MTFQAPFQPKPSYDYEMKPRPKACCLLKKTKYRQRGFEKMLNHSFSKSYLLQRY